MTIHAERLAAVRAHLSDLALDGFIVPLTDEHMSEYVGSYAQRLGWLTGFGGSAGSAVVLARHAAIFTDGRYTIQVREQVSGDAWDYVGLPEGSIAGWLVDHAPADARIGYDPWLHTRGTIEEWRAALAQHALTLVAVDANPIDAVWHDRPAPSDAAMTVQPDTLAGVPSAAKRAEVADWLRSERADALVVPALDSIAWLFNIRGQDVARTPVALSYAIVHADGTADLFVAPEKVTAAVREHLGNAVRLHDRAAFADALLRFDGRTVAIDPALAVAAIFDAVEAGGGITLARRDPTVLAKACKNPVEIDGHRAASLRDGAAVTRFLRWIADAARAGEQTERSAAAQLLRFREEGGALRDLSFDTISATGPNGALPHYHVTTQSDRLLAPGDLYLVDSGGQYDDGTTDLTRVVPIGAPTAEMRDRYTRVLKGHIALATAVFPHGTTGGQLDTLARMPLWQAGLDYAHGTGHGVGSFLAVHEGPARIAKPSYPGAGPSEPLRAGMILSNEPGYYKAGEYGIRIENLLLTVPHTPSGGEAEMLAFETLTLAPLDRDLVEPVLLTRAERAWVDDYHARVLYALTPLLDDADHDWLRARCAPLVG